VQIGRKCIIGNTVRGVADELKGKRQVLQRENKPVDGPAVCDFSTRRF